MALIIFVCCANITNISRNFSLSQIETLSPLNSNSPLPSAPAPGNHYSTFLSLWIWFLCILHIIGIMQYLFLCFWFISVSIMSSRFTHVVAYVRISFLFKAESYSIVYLCIPHFVYPFIHWWTFVFPHLGCCEQCYEHGCANISSRPYFANLGGIYPEVE